MQPSPDKISSAVVSGRFGIAGCSELHHLLIQATTFGMGQGVTSRWVGSAHTATKVTSQLMFSPP